MKLATLFLIVTLTIGFAAARASSAAQASNPTRAEELARKWDARVTAATNRIPAYEGRQRYFLEAKQHSQVALAAAELDRIATEAPSDYAYRQYALYKLEECLTLLGEDSKNRGLLAPAKSHFEAAIAACDRALVDEPDYFWLHYARGMSQFNLERYAAAEADFAQAGALSRAVLELEASEPEDPEVERRRLEAKDIHMRAGYRHADSLARMHRRVEATEAFEQHFRAHANETWFEWDYGRAMVDMHLFHRDYEEARVVLERLLEKPEHREHPDGFEHLGYILAMLDERAEAAAQLDLAIRRARDSGGQLYPNLFQWIFAADEAQRASSAQSLFTLLREAPLPKWERQVVSFLLWDDMPAIAEGRAALVVDGPSVEELVAEVRAKCEALGDGSVEVFSKLAASERARRIAVNQALGQLACEVSFFSGFRHERTAALAGTAGARRAAQAKAATAYEAALGVHLTAFKWEWEYARSRLAALSVGLPTRAPRALSGKLHSALVHRIGESTPRRLESLDDYKPRMGDYLQLVVDEGAHRTLRHDVIVRAPQ